MLNQVTIDKINYRELLDSALDPKQEKRLDQAFLAFHNYSVLNQILAILQMDEISPIASAGSWLKKGRSVKADSKPIMLIVPVKVPLFDDNNRPLIDTRGYQRERLVGFSYQAKWFSLKQTDGEPLDWHCDHASLGQWDIKLAQKALEIEVVDFDRFNGNVQGFARKREVSNRVFKEVAVNPLATYPQSALFHELAHHVLGHLNGYYGDATLMTDLQKHVSAEVEAESVAFICCAALGLEGLAESRDYIHSYLKDRDLTDRQAQRIFTAANKILKAGFSTIERC